MHVAVIGASGRVGSRIVRELVDRGHTVTGICRHPENVAKLAGVTARRGDVLDRDGLADLVRGHDAVVSSVMCLQSDPGILLDAMRASGVKRYLVVGGAGSLEVAPGLRLIDSPEFPPDYKPEAGAGAAFYDLLLTVDDLDWTFVSPSYVFVPGERTGQFRLGTHELLMKDGVSTISFEDYAIALVDEIERPRHVKGRFTVGY